MNAKLAARRASAKRRKAKIEAKVAELKTSGLSEVEISKVLETEYDMTQQRAWLFVHGKYDISPKVEIKPVPQFLRDWEAES